MGNSDAATPPKSDKASSPVQPNIHPYPDWAAMQAYYGPGVAIPPPYFGTAVTSSHAPPYMWGPQPLMPPYGAPYTAIYPHGGVYSHPSLALGSHPHCHGIAPSPTTSEAVVATPLSIETPTKLPNNKDRSLMKRLKGLDGLAVSVGNDNAANTARGAMHERSHSGECGAEGSSDGSDESNESGVNEAERKTSAEGTPTGKDEKVDTLANAVHCGDTNASSNMSLGVTIASANMTGKPVVTAPSCSPTPGMEFRISATTKLNAGDGVPPELWIQDEREVKRERRKQSNRESARRSRLRKQAESEELALKVDAVNTENMTLRSEIRRLTENSEKLRLENSALMEKLKNAQTEGMPPDVTEFRGAPSVGLENFLSKINCSSPIRRSDQQETEGHENSGGKLQQLLDSSPRTDAVAAG